MAATDATIADYCNQLGIDTPLMDRLNYILFGHAPSGQAVTTRYPDKKIDKLKHTVSSFVQLMSTATTHIKTDKQLIPELRFKEFVKEWKNGTLGDYYNRLSTGMTPSRRNPEFFKGDIP